MGIILFFLCTQSRRNRGNDLDLKVDFRVFFMAGHNQSGANRSLQDTAMELSAPRPEAGLPPGSSQADTPFRWRNHSRDPRFNAFDGIG